MGVVGGEEIFELKATKARKPMVCKAGNGGLGQGESGPPTKG